MPSKSYRTYQDLLKDVDALILVHQTLSEGKKGRKYLGHITRSGVVKLCAAWETYVEELVLECLRIIVNEINDASRLPVEIQKTISSFVKTHKNELKPIELTGDGWKKILQDLASERTSKLNTPKSTNLDPIYKEFLGVSGVSNFWKTHTSSEVDDFIKVRGEIAHKGGGAKYVTFIQLQNYLDMINETVKESDICMAQELANNTLPSHQFPWKLTY